MKVLKKRICTNSEAYELLKKKEDSKLFDIEKITKESLEKYYNLAYNEPECKEVIKKLQEKNLSRMEIFQIIFLKIYKFFLLYFTNKKQKKDEYKTIKNS